MTTAASDQTTAAAHPRTRTMASWRARKAVMASRGEVDGPRVAEADAALTWWRHRTYLVRDMGIAAEHADKLMDLIADRYAADAEVVTSA
ncbi:hypothetical protein [Mycobacterium avium]|uniref:hypothetical protein n=1 Tax=Mycobacterium avium TaxID=1764 RepID=UPI000A00A964|nr:hypothetical protein [Mycobacterium avium]MDV3291911.1 hypothetical protein [Mycobacterium avium subsp. hominissuis]TXA41462.1 hypothetical protein DKM27_13015 [Mycobacterium tuberculosis variant bovis]